MQALIAGVAAVDWRTVGTQTWTWTRAQATTVAAFLSGLPRDCQLAALHTSLVCAGHDPQYYDYPGFGPFSLAWGWMIVGALVGGTAMYMMLSFMGRLRQERTMPMALASPSIAGPTAVPLPSRLVPDRVSD